VANKKLNITPRPRDPFRVTQFFKACSGRDIPFRVLTKNDSGLTREIFTNDIQRPSLPLTGFFDEFKHDRIQVLGQGEITYIQAMSPKARTKIFKKICSFNIPCILTSHNKIPPAEIVSTAEEAGVTIAVFDLPTMELFEGIRGILLGAFAPEAHVHGTLVDVYGVGQLYIGKSGVGKSEIALDLLERGHRLVADDLVRLTVENDSLVGSTNKMLGHHMEIRGMGIIDVQALFGIRATRDEKRIEVVVELAEWGENRNWDRLGLDDTRLDILGVSVNHVTIPIFPGKNVTVIAEVIAMNALLRMSGVNSAQKFEQSLVEKMRKAKKKGMTF